MQNVICILAFTDNYIWMLLDQAGKVGAVVDPGDAKPVLDYCDKHDVSLSAILITHLHNDHIGGVDALLARFPGIPVYGPAAEPISCVTHQMYEDDLLVLKEQDIRMLVWDVPGHTSGHIAYVGDCALFCGDTLFGAGCGRVFSGTHEQLYAAMARIHDLPGDVSVYCAHEYTLDNIGFAKWVEPENQALLEREQRSFELIDAGKSTIPTDVELERQTNPFMRCKEPEVIAAAEAKAGRTLKPGAEVFKVVREWKDSEYD